MREALEKEKPDERKEDDDEEEGLLSGVVDPRTHPVRPGTHTQPCTITDVEDEPESKAFKQFPNQMAQFMAIISKVLSLHCGERFHILVGSEPHACLLPLAQV